MKRFGSSNQMIFIAAIILSIGQPASTECIAERDYKSVHGSSGFARGSIAEARLISIATSFHRLVRRSPVEVKKLLVLTMQGRIWQWKGKDSRRPLKDLLEARDV